jgi:F0F1-type ATP synthase assembly protein I
LVFLKGEDTSRLSPENQAGHGRRRGGLALLGVLGGYTALFIVGGLVAGLLLDHVLHTSPAFLLIGVLGGFGATMVQIIRIAMQELNE